MVREYNVNTKILGILQPRYKDENACLMALHHTELTRFLNLSQLPFLAKNSDIFTSCHLTLQNLGQPATTSTLGAVEKQATAKGTFG